MILSMETLTYFAKVNLCWVLFYGCFWLLFRRHTFFHWNRLYLLFSLLISFALPLISLSHTEVAGIPQVNYMVSETPEITVVNVQPAQKTFPLNDILLGIYSLGFALMLGRLMHGLVRLTRIIVKNEQIPFEDYKLIILPQNHSGAGSFSFFKWLVVSHQDYAHHLDTILRHESVHIRQHHSMDVMLIEVIKTVFWFNPVLWFYKKSMQEIHEYLADEQAPNKERYANFLVSYALHSPVKALTNHFFNRSLLKSRIQMIYKNRTSQWLLGKYLMIIPFLVIVVSLTAARRHVIAPVTATYTTQEKSIKTEIPSAPENDVTGASKETNDAAENTNIKGKIVDKSGLPVRNASVVIKNSKIGTTTNSNGNFELSNIPVDSKIVVSHVSYQAAEFDVNKSKTDYSVTLSPAENLIDEVVVVAYPASLPNNIVDNSKSAKQEYVVVEQKAEFPGGVSEMMKFLGRNIKYPTRAARANVSGSVIISFIVNEYGHIQKADIVKGLGFGLDEEASRVLWSMPKWSPAIQNGEAVASQHTIPIKFHLESPPADNGKKQGYFTNPVMPGTMELRGTNFNFGEANPLIFVDGVKQKDRGKDGIGSFKSENIQSITVLKGESAKGAYGEEGKEGVILVTTKK